MSWYERVPRSLKENVQWRKRMRDACAESESVRQRVWEGCAEDVLFWLAGFVYLYEPRPAIVNGRRMPNVIPFIPWVHQEPIILELRKNLGYCDIALEKSRGEGMSWIAVMLALHDWLFDPLAKVGFVSRTEAAADSPDDPDSLMWKVAWELSQLPTWMVGHERRDYKRSTVEHSLVNYRNGSTIVAYSATGNVGRGGRYKWFLMDELASFPRGADQRAVASTQHATNSRLYVSTPEGSDGAYYEIIHNPSSCLKLSMHWSLNPSRNRGLYRFIHGRAVEQDPVNNPLPAGYIEENKTLFSRLRARGYNLEKGPRSPWYDKECDRPGASPQSIAQELDLDYAGSKHLVFGNEFMEVAESTVRPPTMAGNFDTHPETYDVVFQRNHDGAAELWCELDHAGRPPHGEYVVSADVSSGLGGSYTSNSVCQVFNLTTREQVLEYCTNTVKPSDFADICIGVAKWFWDAYLAWEANGPGGGMTRRVLDRGYANVYRRTLLWKRTRKKQKEVGWWTDDRSKEVMFAEMGRTIRDREFTIRSKKLLDEFRQYVMKGGKIEHSLAMSTLDDSAKGKAHGDRVIALGVGIQAAKDHTHVSEKVVRRVAAEPPQNTLAYRVRQAEIEAERDPDGWEEPTSGDASLTQGFSRILPGIGLAGSSWD